MTTMSDRVTLCLPTSNIQTRSVRSQSFNPPPTLGCHRSRRTLSLPAREKPIIPPAITESSECAPLVHNQNSEEMQRHLQGEGCDIGWFAPILGLLLSLLLFAWACLLSLTEEEQKALFS
ncbi:unnamed protein product [Porites evermanni]|uniref:Uncharacterized protein n=1 Tax=Porites evermanni TaxID=104178 RepID=A0ABN8LZR6_9CNID|nr:unnamed protein product [Porites evermanni]